MAKRFETIDWYENALYYDIIFDVDSENEAAFLHDVHMKHGTSGGHTMFEPGCGSGRLLAALARRGYAGSGIDASEGMLRFAQERYVSTHPTIRCELGDMSAFTVEEPVDLAFCLVSTFGLLTSEEDAERHLQCIAATLKPGGVYVLGIHVIDYDDERIGHERWVGVRDGIEVVCNLRTWPPDEVTRLEPSRSRLTVKRDGETHHYETYFNFFSWSMDEIRPLLSRVPDLEHVATYDFNHVADEQVVFDGDQSDYVLVLRKRGD